MVESPSESPSGSKLGANRVVVTILAWVMAAGMAGLVWLGTQDPLGGLPVTHPLNVVLFGICAAFGVGFTGYIWFYRRKE